MIGFFSKLKASLGFGDHGEKQKATEATQPLLKKPSVRKRQTPTKSPQKNQVPTGAVPKGPSKRAKQKNPRSKQTARQFLEVVLGLDFGTAATKVIVGVPNFPDSPLYAVSFGNLSHKSSELLLPSTFWFDETGTFFLSQPTARAEKLVNLKSSLLESPEEYLLNAHGRPSGVKPMEAVVAFLALVIKHSIGWFEESERKAFGKYTLGWIFNLGLPAAKLENEPSVTAYRCAQEVAWTLSRHQGQLDLTLVKKALKDKSDFKLSKPLTDYEIVPEVAAEVVGYANSNLRTEGLHLLIDVGAGTLDGCVFNLFELDGEDNYSILLADVKPFGCFNLLEITFNKTQHLFSKEGLNKIAIDDPLEPISKDLAVILEGEPKRTEILEIIDKNQEGFRKECLIMIKKLLCLTKQHRYRSSPAWGKNEQINAFLCGGGSSIDFYKNLLQEISEWLKENIHNDGLNILELPKEESLQTNLNNLPYHRLAVARGLSIPSVNIGDIRLPKEIEDMPPMERKSLEHRFVSKDMV